MDARLNANNTRELFTRNMDASSSERWSQQLMESSQDWSTWLGSSQETQQRSAGVPVRPTVVSWSHAAAGRGGGVRVPPSHPSLQQMPHTAAPLPDPRDVTLARDIRVGLHTILSVMSSIPEQLKEVAAEVGRGSLQQQQHPHHHEETRRVVKDTGDTLHALLTGLQDAVTQLQQGQDQAATQQKEVMKKHEEQMEEIIKKMEQLGWRQGAGQRQGEGKEGEEQKEKEEKEEEERVERQRARLEEVLAETKKELRRQVRRLKVAAAGRTASVERAVDGLQEGVSRMCEDLEEVKGLVMQPPPRHDDNNDSNNKSNNNNSPLTISLRQLLASTRNGFEKMESSVKSLKQEVSGLPSHLSEEINQAVREALQQHPIIFSTTANTTNSTTPNTSNNIHNPTTSISVSPIQRTFSAHRPVLPLNENFSLCLSSPVAHVSPITQVTPAGTRTTTTITTTASTTTASTTTSSSSSTHQYHHHQHRHRQQPYSGSVSRQPQSGHSQRPAPPPQHPSSQPYPPLPPPPPSRRPTGHSSNNSRPSHPQQNVNCARTTPTRQLLAKPLSSQQQQHHPQQLNLSRPHNPQNSNVRLSHINNPIPKSSHPQQSNHVPPRPQHLGSKPPHSQHSTSRSTYPLQMRTEVSNSQQTYAVPSHSQQPSFKPPQPQLQMRPRNQPQQMIGSIAPHSQQANNASGKPNDPQRINIKVATSQHTLTLKPRMPQQGKTRHSPTIKIKTHTTTQQPLQHTAPPPQQQHQQHQAPLPQNSTFKQHKTQQNSKSPPKQYMNLRPKPHRLFPQQSSQQRQQVQHERPSLPAPQHIRVKKVSKQQKQQHNPSPPPPPFHADSSTTQHSQHQHHHHSDTQLSTQHQHSNTRNTQIQHGTISKTVPPSLQHFATPPPMPPPGQPQHSAITRHTKPPPSQHHSTKTLTQHQDFLPPHHHHNYYRSPAHRNTNTMVTSTPKTMSHPPASSTPQHQQQTPNSAGNDLNSTVSPWLHNDSDLNWSRQGSAYDPFYSDLSGDVVFVDHEEVVTTSCDGGRLAEEQGMSAGGGDERGLNVECNGSLVTGYMQCAGNMEHGSCVEYDGGEGGGEQCMGEEYVDDSGGGVSAGDRKGDSAGKIDGDVVDLFSVITTTNNGTNALEIAGTQHFTLQKTTSLGQVISSTDEKDAHPLSYDSSSSDEFPAPSTTSVLASLGAAPPPSLPLPPSPPAPASSSTVSGSEWMAMNSEQGQGSTNTRSLHKPPINTQLIQHRQNTTKYVHNTNRATGQRQEAGLMISRTLAVAAVAPSTLIPSVRPEAATPKVRRTPWRTMIPQERRAVGRGKGKGKGATGINDTKTTMDPAHTSAVLQLAHPPTAFPSVIPNMRTPLDAPQNPVAPEGNFSFQTPVGRAKRKHEDEERKEECLRVKRFLVPFPTPVPKLVLFNSSKGKLRANLADTV